MEEALQHEYMQQYFEPSDEPIAKYPFNIDDDAPNDTEYWKSKLEFYAISYFDYFRGYLGRDSTSKPPRPISIN